MASLLGSGLTQDRAMAGISVCFGALAVALSVIGIFAQLTLDVRRRAPELGVRIALGASARAIRRLVLRDASWVIGGGLLLGLPLALAAGRASRALLFEISPTDSIGLFSVGALVTVAGLAAASIPAIRASRMDPIEAVRSESARQ
jgi:ABC-type antimicrobial peptide transport system permease subunit